MPLPDPRLALFGLQASQAAASMAAAIARAVRAAERLEKKMKSPEQQKCDRLWDVAFRLKDGRTIAYQVRAPYSRVYAYHREAVVDGRHPVHIKHDDGGIEVYVTELLSPEFSIRPADTPEAVVTLRGKAIHCGNLFHPQRGYPLHAWEEGEERCDCGQWTAEEWSRWSWPQDWQGRLLLAWRWLIGGFPYRS